MQWDNYRTSLRQHMVNDNFENLLEWSTIQATMFVGNAPYIFDEMPDFEYMSDKEVRDYVKVVKNPKVGTTNTDNICTNLVHQYYHLKQWLDRTKQDITQMTHIVEIGAGYGAMALIIYRLGFRGMYYIVDLPELVTIQKYYLENTTKDVKGQGIIQWDSLPQYCDLLIASHSLSEMPVNERERLLSQVGAKEYLFASSYEYEGVDNAAWFQQFAGTTVGVDWKFYVHPYQENAFYQVGVELSK